MLMVMTRDWSGETLTACKSLHAVGLINEGSNQFTLQSDPGFQVNDKIIVAVGHEAGAGMRGSVGVGGTWPALSYADAGAMAADSSKPANTYAYARDTGLVYQYVSSVWTQPASSQYYIAMAVPRALLATITAKVGLTLTLSVAASATATNANISFDNADIINTRGLGAASNPTNNTLILPAVENARFATSKRLLMTNHSRWRFRGQGKLETEIFSPNGTPSASIWFYVSPGCVMQDFTLRGNARNNGFGLAWDTLGVTETVVTQGAAYPYGCVNSLAQGGTFRDVRVFDVFQMAFGGSYSSFMWAYDCECFLTEGLKQYVQWMYNVADGVGGGFVRCRCDSPYLTAGFEGFRSHYVKIIDCISRNSSVSMNSTGGFLIDGMQMTIEAMSQESLTTFSASNPLFNINSNIQPPSAQLGLGGIIRNCHVVQEGPINALGDVLTAINVNTSNSNIHIHDNHIEHPTANEGVATGINASGADCLIEDNRVIGTNLNNSWGNIACYGNGAANIVRNNIADRIVGGTQSGNQTNAEFEG